MPPPPAETDLVTGRHYSVGGERFVSVTTVLGVLDKPGLAKWRGNVGNDKADEIARAAASYGTDVHALVEMVNRGNRSAIGPVAREIVAPYVAWYDENVATVLGAEKLVISRRFKFAGTADVVVAMNDGSLAVVDLKTSKSALSEDSWALQLAAYSLALEEDDIDARRRIVVRLPKTPSGSLYTLEFPEDSIEVDQRSFLACLRIQQWKSTRTPIREQSRAMRIRMGKGS